MKRTVSALAVILILACVPAARPIDPADAAAAVDAPSASVEFAQVPLYFVQNLGQHAPEALFSAAPPGYQLWITKDGLVFDSSRKAEAGESESARSVSRLTFLGASAEARVEAVEPDACRVNYFRGNDPSGWVRDVPTSRAVLYSALYPETDLKVYGTVGAIEYDWVVRPGGDTNVIRFRYDSSGGARLSAEGDLVVSTAFGDLIHHKPVCYQDISGERRSVTASFKDLEDGAFGFEVGAYDRGLPLVIDPVVLVSSTYIGGAKFDAVSSVAVDSRGVICAVGWSESSDFPVAKAYDSKLSGDEDVILFKFAADGKTLLFATYFGGKGDDRAYEVVVDRRRTIWVVGRSDSTDLPTKEAFDATANGDLDAFLARFNALGNTLLLSTYLGGGQADGASGLAVGADFSVAVSGYSSSKNFPVKEPYQEDLVDGPDVFVAKFNPGVKTLVFSTLLGGQGDEKAAELAMGSDGAVYLAGYTYSSNFPVKNAFDPTRSGGADGFASKFDAKGKLVYSTFIGGGAFDCANSIAIDSKGAAYILGQTESKDFPVMDAYDAVANGRSDAFLLKITPSGQSLEFSTYLGGSKADHGFDIVLDSAGAIWLYGQTESPNFPLKDPVDSTHGGLMDAFLSRLSSNGAKLEFSTFLGGKRGDLTFNMAVTAGGTVVVCGYTESPDFPLLNPYSATYKGEYDGFIVKYKSSTTGTIRSH